MAGPESAGETPRKGNVTFLNQPRASEDPKVQRRQAERLRLAAQADAFIARHELLAGKDIEARFAQDGVASLVVLVDASGEKYALKIPFGGRSTNDEAFAFDRWEEVGVKVPHVFDHGAYDEKHSFILMSQIEAPATDKAYSAEELLEKRIFAEMGATHAQMYGARGEGYGPIGPDGRGAYADFSDWLLNDELQGDAAYVMAEGLVKPELIKKAREILAGYAAEHPESTVCHLDFATNNTFATKPPTVFDPAPEMNIAYIDIGKTIVNMISDGDEAISQYLEGYESGREPLDRRVLHAAVVVMLLRKLRKAHAMGGEQMGARVRRYEKYLADTKHLLEG